MSLTQRLAKRRRFAKVSIFDFNEEWNAKIAAELGDPDIFGHTPSGSNQDANLLYLIGKGGAKSQEVIENEI